MLENTLVLNSDERAAVGSGLGGVSKSQPLLNSTTIAAVVTSLGGPPAAVGIVRLSGPSSVGIVGRLFRPMSKKKMNDSIWKPRSHVVEYGAVMDADGNVIDEVRI